MNDQSEILPFKIEQWDETGTQVENLIARAGHRAVAFSAFEAAARLYPSYRFERARDLFGAFDPATGNFRPLGMAPALPANRLRLD